MRFVVAPDKFKGSATAPEVAAALAAGLRAGRPDLEIAEGPVADGGDGTVAAALAAGFAAVGAAAVFAPQKGASPDDVATLERALARWAALTRSVAGPDVANTAGAGDAGGTGFAALAYLAAQLVPGAELMLDLIGFDAALAGAGLVITGEGSLDRQTLGGEAPVGVARAAGPRGVPVAAVAGRGAAFPSPGRRGRDVCRGV